MRPQKASEKLSQEPCSEGMELYLCARTKEISKQRLKKFVKVIYKSIYKIVLSKNGQD